MPNRREAKIFLVKTIKKADPNGLAYVGRSPGSSARDSDSWFTPAEYLDSVKAVLKKIDLDPFSSAVANKVVGATQIFTAEKSAFDNEWDVCEKARVFMNPPYSAGLCAQAVNRFLNQLESKRFAEGIVLVNNATDTRWFAALFKKCNSICFTDHRISFWNSDGKSISGNTRGQAFIYFGPSTDRFKAIFEKHGYVMKPA